MSDIGRASDEGYEIDEPREPLVLRSRKPLTIISIVALIASTIWAFTAPGIEQTTTPAGVRVPADSAYNPVLAGEALPEGFRQLLPRDAIMPIYDPTFVGPGDAGWPGATDVIGVSLNGEHKAYPVSFLGGRELVVDELGGIPILVSW